MDQLSSESLVEDYETVSRQRITHRSTLTWIAWIATLLLSNLPLVIARDLLGADIPWISSAWIGLALLFFALTYAIPTLKPLRRYFLVIGVIYLLAIVDPILTQTVVWQNLFAGQPEIVSLFGQRVLLVVYTLIVVSVLLLTGVKRQEMFLTVGNLKALLGGQAAATRRRGLSWTVFGTAMALLLGGLFFGFMASQNPDVLSNPAAVLPWLPLILLSAGMNAFSEEVTYRAAPLATLLPGIGPGSALWLTSLWFGLGHYYGGIPSGPVGLVFSGGVALLMGKAMLDTRGLGLPWIIHVVLDTVIYFFIAGAAV